MSEAKLKLCLIFEHFPIDHYFEVATNFLLSEVIPEDEYASKIAMSISDISSFFDRRSSLNIYGDIPISKFDLLCDLVTSSMASWVRDNLHK